MRSVCHQVLGLAGLLAAATTAGCEAHGGAAGPARPVQVGRALPQEGCRQLEPIRVTTGKGGLTSPDAKVALAEGPLKTEAVKLGGDFALVESVAEDAGGTTIISGHAYACAAETIAALDARPKPQPPAPGQAQPPAGPAWPPPDMARGPSAPGAKPVDVVRILPHSGCRGLGEIHGTGYGGFWGHSEDKMANAYGELRSSTAALGGDTALIDAVGGDARTITITGHAYDCSQAVAAAKTGPAPAASADDRLRRLDQLKKDGLITPEEYEAKRKAILDDL